MRNGSPLPLRKRSVRSASNTRALRGCPSTSMVTLAVVPPMSKASTSVDASVAEMREAKMAPPAWPASMSRTGKLRAISMETSPPSDDMMARKPRKPSARKLCSMRAR